MTYLLPKRSILPLLTILPLLATGCTSVAVSNDAIEQNTAQALGLAKGTFTISDRVDDGVKASYSVKTNTGKQYACYVTGGVSIVGRVVSDPVCTEAGTDGKQANTNAGTSSTGSASCNALLKAAGKCK